MATAFTHGFVGAALSRLAPPGVPRRRVALAAALLATLPDLDVLAFSLDIPYSHPLGHRGFSHSLLFAALAGLAAGACFSSPTRGSRAWWRLVGVLALATASHGVLDAFTDAGLGVGFFLPFREERVFFPWRPLHTSPLSVAAFFDGPARRILANELLWVWLPVGVLLGSFRLARGATGCR